LIPDELLRVYQINRIFLNKYGYLKSIKYKLPTNSNKEPIPWYTYSAIEYINQFDLKDKNIFEYGTGYSSLYFAQKVKEIITVEDDEEWFKKISKNKPNNLNILFKEEKSNYLSSIEKLNKKFDIIIIDASYRLDCCAYVKNNLNSGGMVILDNSDWFNNCADYLREELNLIQVDFSGFGPINGYTWTTSLFLTRDFNFKVINNKQPQMPIGGII
jgi:hypothetical protein